MAQKSYVKGALYAISDSTRLSEREIARLQHEDLYPLVAVDTILVSKDLLILAQDYYLDSSMSAKATNKYSDVIRKLYIVAVVRHKDQSFDTTLLPLNMLAGSELYEEEEVEWLFSEDKQKWYLGYWQLTPKRTAVGSIPLNTAGTGFQVDFAFVVSDNKVEGYKEFPFNKLYEQRGDGSWAVKAQFQTEEAHKTPIKLTKTERLGLVRTTGKLTKEEINALKGYYNALITK